MSTNAEIQAEIFKSVLRKYFFSNDKVLETFLGMDIESLNRDENMKKVIAMSSNPNEPKRLWDLMQEHAFNKFYNRIMSGGCILGEDGKAYPVKTSANGAYVPSDALLYDFMSGKRISFMGAGNDGMQSVSADPLDLNTLQRDVNARMRGNKSAVPHVYEKDINTEWWDLDAQLNQKYGDIPESQDPPKSNFFQTLFNKIKKKITGRPTALWAPYEKHQERVMLTNIETTALSQKELGNELSEENIKAAQDSVGNKEWSKAFSNYQKNKREEERLMKEKADRDRLEQEQKEQSEGEIEQIVEEQNEVADNSSVAEESAAEKKNEISEAQPAAEESPKEKEESKEDIGDAKKLREESARKTKENDVRMQAIASYETAFLGMSPWVKNIQAPYFIANEKHFMSVFAPGTYRKDAIPEVSSMLNGSIGVLHKYAQDDHVDFNKIDQLPEQLATVYLLGKLKAGYKDREQYVNAIGDIPFEELAEYNQTIIRFKELKEGISEFIKRTNFTAAINKEPANVINTYILNPKADFCKQFDDIVREKGWTAQFDKALKGAGFVKEKDTDQPKAEEDGLKLNLI